MPRSKGSNRSFSHTQKQVLNESTVLTLQKEIDAYTRKVEIERRKLFMTEQTYATIKQEVEDRTQSVNLLKKQQVTKCQNKDQAEQQSLRLQIEQYNAKFSESLAQIEELKTQINVTRKERSMIMEGLNSVQEELHQIEHTVAEHSNIITQKQSYADQTQQKMYMLKTKNEEEKFKYQSQFDELREKTIKERQDKEKKNKTKQKNNFQTFDTATLLKKRLQKIIANNKDKVKIIDSYQRNMRIVDEAFSQIKESTGLTDIEEIQQNFIKSEEQNYALWTYVDILNQQMDALEDENQELEDRCSLQEKENIERMRILQATPEGERKRRKIEAIITSKNEDIKIFQGRLGRIQPMFEQLLTKLIYSQFNTDLIRRSTYQPGFALTETNIDQYLAELEEYVNQLVLYKAKKCLKENFYTSALLLSDIPSKDLKSKQVPNPVIYVEETQDQSDRLMPSQLKTYAVDFLEKKQKTSNTLPKEEPMKRSSKVGAL